jgi:hypothetical protein
MKIQKQLPQFEGVPTMLMALGGRAGVFYFAKDGAIEKIGECEIEYPHYSDKEGFFKSRSRGAVVTGSVREIRKDLLEQQFADACGKTFRALDKSHKAKEIILYAPSRLKNRLTEALPKPAVTKIKRVISGDHHEKHPFELLKMLQVKR